MINLKDIENDKEIKIKLKIVDYHIHSACVHLLAEKGLNNNLL
jgi:hypothetical protein